MHVGRRWGAALEWWWPGGGAVAHRRAADHRQVASWSVECEKGPGGSIQRAWIDSRGQGRLRGVEIRVGGVRGEPVGSTARQVSDGEVPRFGWRAAGCAQAGWSGGLPCSRGGRGRPDMLTGAGDERLGRMAVREVPSGVDTSGMLGTCAAVRNDGA